jgi:hypothetical protein
MKPDKRKLKPFNLSIIQVCPECGKVDVYLNDGHDCNREYQIRRQEDLYDYGDN